MGIVIRHHKDPTRIKTSMMECHKGLITAHLISFDRVGVFRSVFLRRCGNSNLLQDSWQALSSPTETSSNFVKDQSSTEKPVTMKSCNCPNPQTYTLSGTILGDSFPHNP